MSASFLMAQTTIWSVDFETGYADNDELAQDNNAPAGLDWTKSGVPSNWWRVESDNAISGSFSMSGRNTDGPMTWTSETIDISGFVNISISIDLAEVNCEAGDIIETFYDLGSGNVEFGNGNGDGNFNSASNSINGLNGTSLTLTVRLNNNGGGERSIFDNVLVQGTASQGYLGPGGVGDTDGSGELEFWYIAEETSFSNGDLVNTVPDLSGNGRTLTAIGGERPTFLDNEVNGLAAFDFNLNDELETTYQGSSNENMSFGMAMSYDANAGLNIALQHGGRNTIGVNGADFYADFVGGSNHTSTTTATSAWVYHAKRFANTGSNRLNFYVDNANTDNFTHNIENRTSNTWIGGHGTGGGTGFDGRIAEVYKYSKVLNSIEQLLIANYFAAKYGLTLASDDVYDEDDDGFDFDVAGIGQAADGSAHTDAQGTGLVRINTPANLDNGEYLIWGHNNEPLNAYNVTDLPTSIERKIDREWKVSETGELGDIFISFDLSSVFGPITASDLRLLIDTDGDGFFSDETVETGGVISGATDLGGDVFQWTGINFDDNDLFSIGSIDFENTPLPVELLSFTADRMADQTVNVNWVTATEQNNDYFTVERSEDGNLWEWVGELPGAANSNVKIEYQLQDPKPMAGFSYYRLKQTDFNGEFEYFGPVAVQGMNQDDRAKAEAFIYPNPSNGRKLFVELVNFKSDTYQINIMNQAGTLLLDRSLTIEEGVSYVELELLHGRVLESGLHLIRISSFDKVVVKKYIVK